MCFAVSATQPRVALSPSRSTSQDDPMRKNWIDATAVGAIAGATLGFELLQTKVLSALYYNHVVYLTVAIALMGFGISGVLISLAGKRLLSNARRLATLATGALAVSMFVCLAAASHVPAL